MKYIILILALVFLTACTTVDNTGHFQITNITCDAINPECPDNLECMKFENQATPLCAEKDPCNYYCDVGQECVILESFPIQISCR